MMVALQMTAVALALVGTWLIRKPGRWMPWGFACWLVSNPMAMLFMAITGHWLFFAQHLVFFALAAEGAWNWLIKPWLEERRAHPPSRHCACGFCVKYFNE